MKSIEIATEVVKGYCCVFCDKCNTLNCSAYQTHKSYIQTVTSMGTNSNRNRVTLEESYSLLKQNNEILKQNNLLLKEVIRLLRSVDERLRKISINTS